MQCEVFETRLNQLLDRRERPETDDFLQAHAAGCEACRELLAVQELLFDGLDLLEKPEPSPGFSRRVLALTVSPSRRTGNLPPRWVVLAGSLAAVLLAAVFVGPRYLPRRDANVAGPSKPAKTTGGGNGAAALVNPGRVIRKAEKGGELRPALPAPGEKDMTDREYRQALEQLPQRLPAVQRDALHTVEQIPGGLKPIATSFGVAVGLIRNTLPRPKDEPTPAKPQAAYPLSQDFIV